MPRATRTRRALRAARSAVLTAAAAALLLTLTPPPTSAQPTTTAGDKLQTISSAPRHTVVDEGTFIISQGGTPVRAEEFAIERGDTVLVRANSTVSLAGQAPRPADKSMVLLVGPMDFAMGSYWSQQTMGQDTLRRGVEVSTRDTVVTLWREFDQAGTGSAIALPPGRVYVLDPPLFTTFDLIGRTLNGKVCDRRPIKVLVLGVQDSVVDGTVTDVGNETIRWGGRPVQTRKLVIADQTSSFTGWFSPEDGRMLRLEQARNGIRVDRKPPPLKARPPRTR